LLKDAAAAGDIQMEAALSAKIQADSENFV
jgi:hypothetical protein